jgi:hypothetical protein
MLVTMLFREVLAAEAETMVSLVLQVRHVKEMMVEIQVDKVELAEVELVL